MIIDILGRHKRSSDSQDISTCLSTAEAIYLVYRQLFNVGRGVQCIRQRPNGEMEANHVVLDFALTDYLASCTIFPIFFPPKYRHLCSYFYRLDKSLKKHLPMRRGLLCSCGPIQGLIPTVSSGTPWIFSNQTSMHFHFEIVSDRYCAIDICICLSIVWA